MWGDLFGFWTPRLPYIFRMLRYAASFAILLTAFSGIGRGQQHAVDPTQGFHRLICLVHLTGSGTLDDPMRPEYVPPPGAASSRAGIIAWAFQVTDDGTMAIVHLVAADRKAFRSIFADTRPEIRVFEIGVATRAQIEAELGMYKAGFTLDKLKVVAR
jgi:hypothetical protein